MLFFKGSVWQFHLLPWWFWSGPGLEHSPLELPACHERWTVFYKKLKFWLWSKICNVGATEGYGDRRGGWGVWRFHFALKQLGAEPLSNSNWGGIFQIYIPTNTAFMLFQINLNEQPRYMHSHCNLCRRKWTFFYFLIWKNIRYCCSVWRLLLVFLKSYFSFGS